MTQYPAKIVFLVFAGLLQTACGNSGERTENTSHEAVASGGSSQQPLLTTGIDSNDGGKPSAPVDISFAISGKPTAAKSSDIEVTVVAAAASERIDLALHATRGLELTGNVVTTSFFNAAEGQRFQHRLKFEPRADGVYFVYAMATIHLPNGPQARSVGVRIIVGDVATSEKPTAAQMIDSSGEPITSQRAVETTR